MKLSSDLKFMFNHFTIIATLLISTLFCEAQNIDTLKINIEIEGKLIVKNGLIVNESVTFFNGITKQKFTNIIEKEKGDSTFIKILFRKNHEIFIGFDNNKSYNVLILKTKVKFSGLKYLRGFIQLKYFCKPYNVQFQYDGGVTCWRKSIMSKKCRSKFIDD